jgi:chromosome segregation ATPase
MVAMQVRLDATLDKCKKQAAYARRLEDRLERADLQDKERVKEIRRLTSEVAKRDTQIRKLSLRIEEKRVNMKRLIDDYDILRRRLCKIMKLTDEVLG